MGKSDLKTYCVAKKKEGKAGKPLCTFLAAGDKEAKAIHMNRFKGSHHKQSLCEVVGWDRSLWRQVV